MGKAGKARKRGSRRSQPFDSEDRPRGVHHAAGSGSIILSMISSIDEKKRASALDLLLHICSSKSNRKNLHQLFSKDLCSQLSVRLIDTNEGIRTKTARVLDVVAALGSPYCQALLKHISLDIILRLLMEASTTTFNDYARHLLHCTTNIAFFASDHNIIDSCLALIFRLFESRSPICTKFAFTISLLQLFGGESSRKRLALSPSLHEIKKSLDSFKNTNFSTQEHEGGLLSAACVFVSWVFYGGMDSSSVSESSESARKAFCLISQIMKKELEELPGDAAAGGAESVTSINICKLAIETIRNVLAAVSRVEDEQSSSAKSLLIECLSSSRSVEVFSQAVTACSAHLRAVGYDSIASGAASADLAEVVEVALECIGASTSCLSGTAQEFSVSGSLSVVLSLFGDLCEAADKPAAVAVPVPASVAVDPPQGKAMEVSDDIDAGDESEDDDSSSNILQNLTTACAECLCEVITNTTCQTMLSFGEELTQRMALSLCRGLSRAEDSVALPCSVAMGALGSKEQYSLPSKLNGLLSNALLRCLCDSSAEAPLVLHDSCFSSFIDLHSSDDPEYLSNFSRLGALAKLTSALDAFEGRLRTTSEAAQEEISQFEDTAETVRSFIEYKENYIKATMH